MNDFDNQYIVLHLFKGIVIFHIITIKIIIYEIFLFKLIKFVLLNKLFFVFFFTIGYNFTKLCKFLTTLNIFN